MPSLPSRFRRNVTSNYLRTGASVFVALVMTPVLVHGLGKTDYGIWVLAFSLALYLELLEFGFGTATVKYVAESEALGERDRLRGTVATSFWILCVPGLLALALGITVALLFPVLFDIPPSSENAARILVLLVAADLAISIPSDTFGGVLMGLQRYDIINATLIVVLLAQAASWAIVIATGGGLVALAIVTVVLSLLGQLSRFLLARRLVPGLSVSPRFFDRSRVRSLSALSIWYALSETATVVIVRIDTIVVGLVVGVPQAAVYAVGQKLAFLGDQLIRPIVKIFFPHSSALAARGDEKGIRATISTGTRVSVAVAAPLALTLALLAEPALRVWVGSGFSEASLVVVFLACATLLHAVSGTGFLMLQGAGFARGPALMSSTEAVLNLGLSVLLGSLMGLRGVALATLIAAAVVQLGLVLPYLGRVFQISPVRLLGSLLRAHLPAAAVGALVGWLVLQAEIDGLVPLIAAGAAIAGSYTLTLAATGLGRDERRRILSAFRQWRSGEVTPSA